MVVSRLAKAVAWVIVTLMNLFFVYFSLLRGLERGVQWQRIFAGACLLQIFVEIFVYEVAISTYLYFLFRLTMYVF